MCDVAHQRNRRVAAHARSAEAIQHCVRQGVDMIYHATLADEETLDALEEAKDRVFVGPAIGLPVTRLKAGEDRDAGPHAVSTARLRAEIEAVGACARELIKRGVRVVLLRPHLDAPVPRSIDFDPEASLAVSVRAVEFLAQGRSRGKRDHYRFEIERDLLRFRFPRVPLAPHREQRGGVHDGKKLRTGAVANGFDLRRAGFYHREAMASSSLS